MRSRRHRGQFCRCQWTCAVGGAILADIYQGIVWIIAGLRHEDDGVGTSTVLEVRVLVRRCCGVPLLQFIECSSA